VLQYSVSVLRKATRIDADAGGAPVRTLAGTFDPVREFPGSLIVSGL
jgi:hypothetical protein